MRIFYTIFACEKHKERTKGARDTWLKKVCRQDYIFLGDRHNPANNQISYPGIPDDYLTNSRQCCRWLRETNVWDSDWYMIVDSDTYVFTERLQNRFREYPIHAPAAIGYKIACYPYDPSLWYLSGAAYGWNRAAMRLLADLSRKPFIPYNDFLDVMHGYWLRACHIPLCHEERFRCQHPDETGDSLALRAEAITYHHLKRYADFQKVHQWA